MPLVREVPPPSAPSRPNPTLSSPLPPPHMSPAHKVPPPAQNCPRSVLLPTPSPPSPPSISATKCLPLSIRLGSFLLFSTSFLLSSLTLPLSTPLPPQLPLPTPTPPLPSLPGFKLPSPPPPLSPSLKPLPLPSPLLPSPLQSSPPSSPKPTLSKLPPPSLLAYCRRCHPYLKFTNSCCLRLLQSPLRRQICPKPLKLSQTQELQAAMRP